MTGVLGSFLSQQVFEEAIKQTLAQKKKSVPLELYESFSSEKNKIRHRIEMKPTPTHPVPDLHSAMKTAFTVYQLW